MLMLQSLLADRFKLALHRDTRQLPVYDLTAAKDNFNPPAPKEGGCASLDSASPPASRVAPLRHGKNRLFRSNGRRQCDHGELR
jgi:uncharacterized protein (TIGR03435 family)